MSLRSRQKMRHCVPTSDRAPGVRLMQTRVEDVTVHLSTADSHRLYRTPRKREPDAGQSRPGSHDSNASTAPLIVALQDHSTHTHSAEAEVTAAHRQPSAATPQ